MLVLRPSTALSSRDAATSASLEVLPGFASLRRILSARNPLSRFALCSGFGIFLSVTLPASTESAIANGDTRTLNLYNQHTKESISAIYRVNGHYDPAVLEKLNWFLRDWRRNEATRMDPRLFDAVWETYREAGATRPIVVVCGYRSPRTNAMLRRRSRAVARHSQHILGKAMDTEMPGMSMEKVREIAMRLQMGGVGFYGDSSFIHIDVGGIRYWPRMTYAQLMRVFPDGKTVLIPTNGKPLPGYEEARAEIAASGRAAEVPPPEKAKNFFAWLFGLGKGNADEREEETQQGQASPQEAAATRPAVAAGETQVADNAAEATRDDSAKDTAPMPPPRPRDFLALADVPLPPARPRHPSLMMASLSDNGTGQARATAENALLKASQLPVPAGMALPTIITHGASESVLARQSGASNQHGSQALAYAPVAPMDGLRSSIQPKDQPGAPAAWAASAAKIAAPRNAAITKLQAELILSPKLTGLRRVAQVETAALSRKLAAGYLARFASRATNLPTNRFSGPAVVGLRVVDRNRMMFVDSSAASRTGE